MRRSEADQRVRHAGARRAASPGRFSSGPGATTSEASISRAAITGAEAFHYPLAAVHEKAEARARAAAGGGRCRARCRFRAADRRKPAARRRRRMPLRRRHRPGRLFRPPSDAATWRCRVRAAALEAVPSRCSRKAPAPQTGPCCIPVQRRRWRRRACRLRRRRSDARAVIPPRRPGAVAPALRSRVAKSRRRARLLNVREVGLARWNRRNASIARSRASTDGTERSARRARAGPAGRPAAALVARHRRACAVASSLSDTQVSSFRDRRAAEEAIGAEDASSGIAAEPDDRGRAAR